MNQSNNPQTPYLQLLRLFIATLRAIGGEIRIQSSSLEIAEGVSVAVLPSGDGQVIVAVGSGESQLISYKPQPVQQPPQTTGYMQAVPTPLQWTSTAPATTPETVNSNSSKAGARIVLSEEQMLKKQAELTRTKVKQALDALKHPETAEDVEKSAAQRMF